MSEPASPTSGCIWVSVGTPCDCTCQYQTHANYREHESFFPVIDVCYFCPGTAVQYSGMPNTSSSSRNPRIGYDPSDTRGIPAASAKARETNTGQPSSFVKASSRKARLTAGPITVKSRRSAEPTLPYMAVPMCRPMPARRSQSLCAASLAIISLAADNAARAAAGSCAPSAPNTASTPSPMKFQYVAAMRMHTGRHNLEIIVENSDHLFAWQLVRQGSEIAEIRGHDDRAKWLGMAALDLPVQDALSDIAVEIDREEAACCAEGCKHFDHCGKCGPDVFQKRDVRFGEATGPVGRPCDHRKPPADTV